MGTWSFSYDTLNRLAGGSITQPASSGPAASLLANYCWNYDAFGNRVQQESAVNAFSSGGGASPCQPASSGAVSEAISSFDGNNHLTSTNARGLPSTPSYDASGDVLSDGANQYLYDAEGRICAVWNSVTGSMTGYIYDADGNRVSKGTISAWSCNPTTAQFQTQSDYILDLGGQQMSEYAMQPNGTMAWQHTNVWVAGRLIATYAQDTTSTTANALVHFYLDDPLGSRRAQTDFAGNLEQTCANLPYGDGESCPPTPTEHLFTNKQRDAESGNDYFGARYYSSAMGRFMSPDWSAKVEPVPYSKLDDPQTLNLYSYVRNNPLTRTDPDGHFEAEWHLAITFVAAMKTGHGVIGSAKLAWQTTAVDFRKGSQHSDAAHTNMHAMEGRKPDGKLQNAAEARQGTHDVVQNAMKGGDTALALHAVQDLAVPLHDGHAWTGVNGSFVKHFIGDNLPSPSTVAKAYSNSLQVLQGKNPVQVPAQAPPPQPKPRAN